MLNLKTPHKPDLDYYEEEIGVTGNYVYIDYLRFRYRLFEANSRFASAKEILREFMIAYSYGAVVNVNADSFINVLCNYCGVPKKNLMSRGRVSLDVTKKLVPLVDHLQTQHWKSSYSADCGIHLIKQYIEYSKSKSYMERINKIVDILEDCDEVGNDNQPLKKVRYHYERRATGRHYTNDANLQGWNKEMVDCITAPKDYFLVWCDFAQIDLRVAYNIILSEGNPELTKMFDEYSDKYEALTRIIYKSIGKEFDKGEFLAHRKRFKTSCLARLYDSHVGTLVRNIGSQELATALDTYVSTNKGYARYKSMIERVVNFGVELDITDYFGNHRVIPIPDNAESNDWVRLGIVRQGLNTPVQSTSYSIVIEWCNSIIKRFRSKGYDREKVRPYLIRHDEGIFMFHKDVLTDMHILIDNMKIAVDDWSILDLEPELGYHYTVPDENLRVIYEKISADNMLNLTQRTVTEPRSEKYYPVGDVLQVYMYNALGVMDFIDLVMSKVTSKYEAWMSRINSANSEEEKLSIAADYVEEMSKGDDFCSERCRQYLKYNKYILMENEYEHRAILLNDPNDIAKYAGDSKCIKVHNTIAQTEMMIDDKTLKVEFDTVGAVLKEFKRLSVVCRDANVWVSTEGLGDAVE